MSALLATAIGPRALTILPHLRLKPWSMISFQNQKPPRLSSRPISPCCFSGLPSRNGMPCGRAGLKRLHRNHRDQFGPAERTGMRFRWKLQPAPVSAAVRRATVSSSSLPRLGRRLSTAFNCARLPSYHPTLQRRRLMPSGLWQLDLPWLRASVMRYCRGRFQCLVPRGQDSP